MKKALRVILHILGFPVIMALVLFLNWNIIMTQTKNYGIFVFVSVIVTGVIAIIYYICYACITRKKKPGKKQKSVFNQTVRLCMAVVIMMTGLWVVCDFALPDFLADATSSTIYYEDLADGWSDRADVNEELLNKFIELNVNAGTLPTPEGMTAEEATAHYIDLGINNVIDSLNAGAFDESVPEELRYNNIAGLMAIQYQSINANGYQTFTHPWIDFATSDRLTIPCLVHLLLDKREISQDSIKNKDYTTYTENEDGTITVDSVMFAVCDKEKGTIEFKHVDWTVLDMLGTDNVVDLSGLKENPTVSAYLDNVLVKNLLRNLNKEILPKLCQIVKSDDILGSDISIIFDEKAFTVTLRPANEARGVFGYQEMAWLDSNGLVYALVSLFSTRALFLIGAAYLVVINVLIGCTRGMVGEEKERRRRADAPLNKKPPVIPVYGK